VHNDIITLTEAHALSAILHAAGRKATVARLAPATRRVLTGQAQCVMGDPGRPRDYNAESAADVRDLWLAVRPLQDRADGRGWHYWPVRQLIAESPSGRFIADFDVAAFEAAGGQASVPASVAAWEAAHGYLRLAGEPSGQPEDQPWIQSVPDMGFANLITILHAAGSEGRVAPEEAWTRLENILTEEKERRFPDGMTEPGKPSHRSENPLPSPPGSGKQGPFWTARGFGEPVAEFTDRMASALDPADLRGWPREDLLVLARAAGMLWYSTGGNDPYDVLSDDQRELLHRAAGSYLTAEQSEQPDDRPFERSDLVEYLSAAAGPAAREWLPAIFDRYVTGSPYHVYVRPFTRQGPLGVPVLSTRSEVRRISPELISAARSQVADCQWEDVQYEEDVAGLSDADIVRGVHKHTEGGWTAFTAAGNPGPQEADHSEQENQR
jgi:hypothetical protein